MQEKFKPLAKTGNTGRAMVVGPTNPSIEDRFMGEKASRTIHWRHHIAHAVAASAMLAAASFAPGSAVAASEDEVRAAFRQFVTAQNAHDVKAVEELLLPSPDFLWITRGAPIWGRDAALQRFAALYQGTWHLDPETAGMKIVMLGDVAAQIYIPITFAIGPSGQQAQQTKFLMNQVLVKTPAGWKFSSILPIPAPTP
jgi:ketosteroid isomerase-like protein